jgi:hypothetical protein
MPDSISGNRNYKGDGAQAQQSRHLARLRLCRIYFRSLVIVF